MEPGSLALPGKRFLSGRWRAVRSGAAALIFFVALGCALLRLAFTGLLAPTMFSLTALETLRANRAVTG